MLASARIVPGRPMTGEESRKVGDGVTKDTHITDRISVKNLFVASTAYCCMRRIFENYIHTYKEIYVCVLLLGKCVALKARVLIEVEAENERWTEFLVKWNKIISIFFKTQTLK